MSQFKRLLQRILELNSEGMSDTEVARACDVTVGVVQYVMDMYGGQ